MKLQLKIATGSNLEVEILPEDTFATLITRTFEESGISLNLTHFKLPGKKIALSDNVSYYFTGKVPEMSVSSYFPAQLCRLCAKNSYDMTFIFENMELRQSINTWLPTHVSKKDLLPKQVCSNCIERLEMCKAFQVECVRAELTLKKYLESEKFCLKTGISNADETQGQSFDCGFVYGDRKVISLPNEESCPPPMEVNYCCPSCHQGNVCNINEDDVETSDEESELDGSFVSHDLSDFEEEVDDNILEDDVIADDVSDIDDVTEQADSESRENNDYNECDVKPDVSDRVMTTSSRPIRAKRKPFKLLSDAEHAVNDLEAVTRKVIKLEQESSTSDGIKCNICDGYTVSLEQLLQHSFEMHVENNLFPCPLCPLAFHEGPLELISHFSSDHNSEATKELGLFVCKTCYILFSSKLLLLNHDCKVSKSSLKCKECGMEFKTKIRFEFHKQFHVEGSKPLHCEPCSADFMNEDEFYRHFRSLHKDQETKCLDCNKNFVNYSSLVVHRRFHNNIRKYKCGTCTKSFLDKQTLTEHMVSHMQSTPFQCHICHKYLARNSRLKTHLLTHESTSSKPQKAYDCASCHRIFPSQNKYLEHLNEDHENMSDSVAFEVVFVDKVFRCEYCNSNFTTMDGLRTHRESHAGEKKFQCDLCESAFESFARLTTHKMKHGVFKVSKAAAEKAGEPDDFAIPLFYVCNADNCEKMYVQWSYLGIHKRMCHSEVQFMYQCKQCPESFPTSWAVAYHRKTMHSAGNPPREGKPHCCHLCSKSFASFRGLERHQATNHQAETFQCGTCSRIFNKQASLEKHMLVHQEEKTCVCDVCDKRFFHQSSLYKHLKIHLDLTSYLCSICDKRFNDSTSLNEHVRLHTGEKPFQCEVCMKTFRTRGVWLQHVRIHSNQRPYPCEICGVSFRRSWALKNHQLLHTGEKRFQCVTCLMAFRLKQDLQRHVLKEHPCE